MTRAALPVAIALAVAAIASCAPPVVEAPGPEVEVADPGAMWTGAPTAKASSRFWLAGTSGGVTWGNPTGGANTAATGLPIDTTSPDKIVGNGTAASCTSTALQSALFGGGIITFDCGPDPITIPVASTLYLCNTSSCKPGWQDPKWVSLAVVDGRGLVTLSGQGLRGIFYANTCQESFGWRDSSCQNDTTPVVVFQNISFTQGNATGIQSGWDGVGGGGGGGAIAMRGGQLKVYNSHFYGNWCMTAASDGGGGAIRLTGQTATSYIVQSTIESNHCANGGGVSVLQAPVTILNSALLDNTATGSGASSGLGGNGGAVYSDGNSNEVRIEGSVLSGNYAPEGGPGVFYVSNNRTGHLTITDSQIVDNTGQRFYTSPYRDIFYLGRQSLPTVTNSTVE